MVNDSMTRFQRFIAPSDERGCRIWIGSKNAAGYGYFHADGRTTGAHRIAYALAKGPIPDGLEIDHLCRVHSCVNPDHLEAVTQLENLRRRVPRSVTFLKTHCPRGHAYDDANTYIGIHRGKRRRHCRACWPIYKAQRASRRAVA